jgi:hypothetical protein
LHKGIALGFGMATGFRNKPKRTIFDVWCGDPDKVVEYALNRTLSPALIAEYQTMLPDKKLLQGKLNELYNQNASEEDE